MKRPLAIVMALIAVAAFSGTAAAKPAGITTINLRTCVDATDDACLSEAGDVVVDGVVVCLGGSGLSTSCASTEDGEHWLDSLPHGSYRATVETPAGYTLEGITCTTFPNVPYSPCRVRGDEVRFRVGKDLNAVSINFLLEAD